MFLENIPVSDLLSPQISKDGSAMNAQVVLFKKIHYLTENALILLSDSDDGVSQSQLDNNNIHTNYYYLVW